MPPARAVLAANLETAINGVWDARPQLGDRVAVVGGGTVGCLVAWLAARIPGCEVELVDVNPQRADDRRARSACGSRCRRSAAATPTSSFTRAERPTASRSRCGLAGFEATIVEMSWYGDRVVPVPLGEAFHARRLTLKSSQVGAVAAVAARALGHTPPHAARAGAARAIRRSTC